MRTVLNAFLVLAGVMTSVMAVPIKEVATKADFHNHVVVDGLYIVLPTEMKDFPAGLVAEA